MKTICLRAKHIERAWDLLLEVLTWTLPGLCVNPPGDYRKVFSKLRQEVIECLQDGTRWGPKRCGRLFDAAIAVVERQGYVEKAPLGASAEFVLDLSDEGGERLLAGEFPEFEDVVVPIRRAQAEEHPC
jgi:hypothetical protein